MPCLLLFGPTGMGKARIGTHEAKQALMIDQQLADRFQQSGIRALENDLSKGESGMHFVLYVSKK
jgi:hypothetical protein